MEFNEYFVKGMAVLAAGIAILVGIAPALGQSRTASKAVEGAARNPEAAGKIRSLMVLGIALAETTGIYAFIISLLLIFLIAM